MPILGGQPQQNYSQRKPKGVIDSLLATLSGQLVKANNAIPDITKMSNNDLISMALDLTGAGILGTARYPFKKATEMPNIDDIIDQPHLKDYFKDNKNQAAYQVDVTPDEYLKTLSDRDFNINESIQQKVVDDYASIMKKGEAEFPALSFDISGGYFGQEGRHRALAAKKAGIEKVPVSVKYDADNEGLVPFIYRYEHNK